MSDHISTNELMNKIADLLGIHKYARKFTITFEVGCEAIVNVDHYIGIEFTKEAIAGDMSELALVTTRYSLKEIDAPKVEPINMDDPRVVEREQLNGQ